MRTADETRDPPLPIAQSPTVEAQRQRQDLGDEEHDQTRPRRSTAVVAWPRRRGDEVARWQTTQDGLSFRIEGGSQAGAVALANVHPAWPRIRYSSIDDIGPTSEAAARSR